MDTAGGFDGARCWSISAMPTLRPDKGNCWMARVIMNGRQVACKMFPAGKKHGPEWRAAKEWEEEQKKIAREGMTIPTALELLMAWGDSYLTHVQRTMSRQTYVEKKLVTKDFFAYCGKKASMTSRKSLRQEPMSFFPESRMSAERTSPTSTARICWLHGTGVPTSLRDSHRWHHHF